MKYLYRYFVYISFILILSGCKKPYSANISPSTTSILVVEGFINIGDTTIIKLSRTVDIYSTAVTNAVSHAIITIEDDQNGSTPLIEIANGKYTSGSAVFDAAHKYRVRIKTTGNKEYLSDFTQPVIAPLIDSVGYALATGGAQFYVNTHNSNNYTRYYRWEYKETWIILTKFISLFKAITQPANYLVNRKLSQQISRCWASDTSSSITLGSSASLKQNIINQAPLTLIPLSSERFTERYSISVDQYALSKDAYIYYGKLKKNTEQLGGIFDAQPSQLTGNIRCISNPAELVIGFISAGSVTHKRVYVNKEDLPPAILDAPYSGCELDSLLYTDSYFTRFYYTNEIPVNAIVNPKNSRDTLGFTGSSGVCVDCTLRGRNQPPAFWK